MDKTFLRFNGIPNFHLSLKLQQAYFKITFIFVILIPYHTFLLLVETKQLASISARPLFSFFPFFILQLNSFY